MGLLLSFLRKDQQKGGLTISNEKKTPTNKTSVLSDLPLTSKMLGLLLSFLNITEGYVRKDHEGDVKKRSTE